MIYQMCETLSCKKILFINRQAKGINISKIKIERKCYYGKKEYSCNTS